MVGLERATPTYRGTALLSSDLLRRWQVSLSEFKRWLEANGAARGMTDEEVEMLFKAVDVDNSGAVVLRCFSVVPGHSHIRQII